MKNSRTWVAWTHYLLLTYAGLWLTGCATPRYLDVNSLPDNAYYATPESPPRYVLQPGDTISVTFHLVPRFDTIRKIGPDGYISIAPVDEVEAAGLTAAQLDETLTLLAAKHMETPDLTVSVSEFAMHKIYVGGEVRRGGIQELQSRMTPFQAIMQAGGSASTAQMKQVLIIRNGTPEDREVFGIDLSDESLEQRSTRQFYLKPFDVVYVPKSRIAKVNQYVDQYINKLIPIDFVGSAGINYIVQDKENTSNVTISPGR